MAEGSVYNIKGKRHDFRVFKELKIRIVSTTKVLADAGYKRMQKIHVDVKLPHRTAKNILCEIIQSRK